MFAFNPMTENEIKKMNLINEGKYQFEVIKSSIKTSDAGNQMIEVYLKIYDENGNTRFLYDYLMSLPTMIYKLHHFCMSVGMENEYKNGSLKIEDLVNKGGIVHIKIKKNQVNPEGGTFPEKNFVRDYLTKEDFKEDKKEVFDFKADKDLNDDIPF